MGPAEIARASSVHRGLPAKKRHTVLALAGTGRRTNGAHVARDPAWDTCCGWISSNAAPSPPGPMNEDIYHHARKYH